MTRIYQDKLLERVKELTKVINKKQTPEDEKRMAIKEKATCQLKFCLDLSRDNGTLFICTHDLIETVLEILEPVEKSNESSSEKE